jgi:RNA polymerase-binding transcription factor DksA
MEDQNKIRYSDEELEEFRILIQDKIEKAIKQLDFYQVQIDDLTNGPDGHIKGLDDGIATSEAEHVMQMMARTKKHIKHLESALIRIENKVYGVCRVTGKLIAKERLRAVPHATLSIEAKQNMDKF